MSFFHIVIKHFTFFFITGVYIYEHWLVHWYINNLKTKIQHIEIKQVHHSACTAH